ncbi:MAG: flagellar basal body rod modification protein [Burkholderiaceae bacterium]|nr:flagellar basal body rod modification protein [Burkholderiaceae bacterium]
MQTQNNLFSNAAGNSGAATIAKAETSATSDMFTKLLVAQIRNQDPLSPSDPSQFVNQLAQLSQTEALSKLSNLASANASVMQSLQVLALGAQVGSSVMVATDHVRVGQDKIEGNIALSASSTKTTLVLTGADGVAHEVKLGTLTPGNVPFSVDPTALGLAAGDYTMSVKTSTGESPAIDIAGKLNSVRLSSAGGTLLNVSGVGEVEPGAVTAFNGKSGATL